MKGRILQVVENSTNTVVNTSTTSWVDTGLTVTITPKSSTSKILIFVSQNGLYKDGNVGGLNLKLMRTGLDLSYFGYYIAFNGISGQTNSVGGSSAVMTDAPATTSAVTYKTQFSALATGSGGAYVQLNNSRSHILLVEVSA